MNNKKLFDVFINHNDSKFDLYNEIKTILEEEIINARGIENAKAYNVLTKLSNSENNAGWKDRHSDRIAAIDKAMSDIADDYEKYLP